MKREMERTAMWFVLCAAARCFAAEPAPPGPQPQPAKPPAKPAANAEPAKPPAAKPAPAQPKPAAKSPPLPKGMLMLNFKNASLKSVLSYIAEKSGLIVYYQHDVSGDITVVSPKPMDLDAALGVLNAALVTKKAVAVRSGNILKIVSLPDAKKANLPIFQGADPDAVQEGEQFITQIIPLRVVQAEQIAKDLKNMIPDYAELATNKDSNTLIYTAAATDVKRLLRILHALDSEIAQVATVRVFHLQNADAKSVESAIQSLFSETGASSRRMSRRDFFMRFRMGGPRPPARSSSGASRVEQAYRAVKVTSDERTNSVVVIASKDKMELIAALVEQLDAAPTEAVGAIKIYTLKNADATALAQTITELFASSSSTSRSRNSVRSLYLRYRFGIRSGGASTPSGRHAEAYEEVRVSVDLRTNSIIVVASDDKHEQIAQIVKELDTDATETESAMAYKCKFANAVTVANVINDLFAEPNRRSRTSRSSTRGSRGVSRTSLSSRTSSLSSSSRTRR